MASLSLCPVCADLMVGDYDSCTSCRSDPTTERIGAKMAVLDQIVEQAMDDAHERKTFAVLLSERRKTAARLLMRVLKRCSKCTKCLTFFSWNRLEYAGIQEAGDAGGDALELRNCICGTTLAVPTYTIGDTSAEIILELKKLSDPSRPG